MSKDKNGNLLWAGFWTVLFGISLGALYCVGLAEDINPTAIVAIITLAAVGTFISAYNRARIAFGDEAGKEWLDERGFAVEFLSGIASALPIAVFINLADYPSMLVFVSLALGALPLLDHYWPQLSKRDSDSDAAEAEADADNQE